MRCEEYEEYRVLYACGELKDKEKRKFEDHLHSCPYCQKYIEEFVGVLSLYHTLPKKGPSERTVRRILKRAGRFYRPASERRRILINRRVGWSIPVFAGAVALLLLFILPRIRTRDIAYDFEGKVWSMSQEIILMTESVSLDNDIDSRIDGLVSELSFIEEEW